MTRAPLGGAGAIEGEHQVETARRHADPVAARLIGRDRQGDRAREEELQRRYRQQRSYR
jgi:hypothetical protein